MSTMYVLNGHLGWDGSAGEGSSLLSITPIIQSPTFSGEGHVGTSIGPIALADFFKVHADCKFATVRYAVSTQQITDPNNLGGLMPKGILAVSGEVEAGVFHRYSHSTGYLWSNETLIVDKLNLYKELSNYANQGYEYIHMEITVI